MPYNKPEPPYDLFVSYAREDDRTTNPKEIGWVRKLADNLDLELSKVLGWRPSIFFDQRVIGPSDSTDDLEAAARISHLFLVVETPTYHSHKWTERELDAFFTEKHDDHDLL